MSSNSRQGCAERIKICENGFIPTGEKMTSCGLNQGALAADGDYPAVSARNPDRWKNAAYRKRGVQAEETTYYT